MFEIKTFLELHTYDYTDPYYFNNPEARYISLEDSLALRNYFDHRKFTPEHIQMLIRIRYGDNDVVGLSSPSGLDLWDDYINAIEDYIHNNNTSIMFATGLRRKKLGNRHQKIYQS